MTNSAILSSLGSAFRGSIIPSKLIAVAIRHRTNIFVEKVIILLIIL
jgi:hypothetical protein